MRSPDLCWQGPVSAAGDMAVPSSFPPTLHDPHGRAGERDSSPCGGTVFRAGRQRHFMWRGGTLGHRGNTEGNSVDLSLSSLGDLVREEGSTWPWQLHWFWKLPQGSACFPSLCSHLASLLKGQAAFPPLNEHWPHVPSWAGP